MVNRRAAYDEDNGSDDSGSEEETSLQKLKISDDVSEDDSDNSDGSGSGSDDDEDDDDNNVGVGGGGRTMKSLFSKVSALDAADAKAPATTSGAGHVNHQAHYQKALALKSQVALHHKLIEMRIHLQHVLHAASNKDLYPGAASTSTKSTSTEGEKQHVLQQCDHLFHTLYDARQAMVQDRLSLDLEVPPKSDDLPQKRATLQATHEALVTDFWKPVLNKRHAEVHVRSGKQLASSSSQNNKKFKSVVDQSFYDQVESTVTHERLLHNPQSREPHVLLQTVKATTSMQESDDDDSSSSSTSSDDEKETQKGKEKEEPVVALLYNDSKLYQNMLKDFLKSSASRAVDGGGAAEERQRLQKQMNKQKNKMVDRRASKGRKIRYHVHDKMTNFAFPIPRSVPAIEDDAWFQTLFRGGR
jgi:protein AATF/BFR2